MHVRISIFHDLATGPGRRRVDPRADVVTRYGVMMAARDRHGDASDVKCGSSEEEPRPIFLNDGCTSLHVEQCYLRARLLEAEPHQG